MTRLGVVAAGPLVSFQDAGRPGVLRFGVPASGPMDRLAHAAANLAVGNPADATAVEVSVAGLELQVLEGSVTAAVAGGGMTIRHGGLETPSWNVVTLRAGQRLVVRAGGWGSWSYVALAGRVEAPSWLGHTATHSTSGLGGGMLVAGHEFHVAGARIDVERDGEIPKPDFARPIGPIRIVAGPQDRHFRPGAIDELTRSEYTLTDAYDRMGVRLAGPVLEPGNVLSIPSEPIVRGSIQVTGDGVPTVLLADHQTTGGYPKVATLVSSDIDRFVQRRAGDPVRFRAIDAAEAVRVVRADAALAARYLSVVAGPGRTLSHRLRRENLIAGAVAANLDGELHGG